MKEKIEALIKRWRWEASKNITSTTTYLSDKECCANQLERLLKSEEAGK